MSAALFTPGEALALAPEERISCSEWADRYRTFTSRDSAEYGRPWRTDRAPYLREIMDALTDPQVETVLLMKAARVGGSEALRNAIACWIDQDPGPVLLVYPSEDSSREQLANEIRPMLEGTPRLARHLTGKPRDLTSYDLETMRARIYIGWAGSPQALASRTIRYAVADEVDKFPAFSGTDAAPLALLARRTATYGDRKKIIITSTPTTRQGAIYREWEASVDRRRYHVPCPHCGALQPLTFGQVRWAKDDRETRQETANRLAVTRDVWYECAECEGRIEERHKATILAAGVWVSEGHEPGSHPLSRRRAYHISALYSQLGVTWAQVAAEWVAAQGDMAKLYEVVTQNFGEPFEDQTAKVVDAKLAARVPKDVKPGLVPRWASHVFLTVDTQKEGFWYVSRAWGRGERSRKLAHGRLKDWAAVDAILATKYAVEGHPHETVPPSLCLIDAGGGAEGAEGSRTDEVYRWCQRDPSRRLPIKGAGGNTQMATPIRVSAVDYMPKGAKIAYRVMLHLIDTQHFKDVLAHKIDSGEGWEIGDADEEYARHMTAEHKVAIRRGLHMKQMWVARSHGRRVDLWDCEVYQLAAAKIAKVEGAPTEIDLERERATRTPENMRHGRDGGGWVNGSGWQQRTGRA